MAWYDHVAAALCDGCDRMFPTGQVAADDAGSGQFCHRCRYVANHGSTFDWVALDYEEDPA